MFVILDFTTRSFRKYRALKKVFLSLSIDFAWSLNVTYPRPRILDPAPALNVVSSVSPPPQSCLEWTIALQLNYTVTCSKVLIKRVKRIDYKGDLCCFDFLVVDILILNPQKYKKHHTKMSLNNIRIRVIWWNIFTIKHVVEKHWVKVKFIGRRNLNLLPSHLISVVT